MDLLRMDRIWERHRFTDGEIHTVEEYTYGITMAELQHMWHLAQYEGWTTRHALSTGPVDTAPQGLVLATLASSTPGPENECWELWARII